MYVLDEGLVSCQGMTNEMSVHIAYKSGPLSLDRRNSIVFVKNESPTKREF